MILTYSLKQLMSLEQFELLKLGKWKRINIPYFNFTIKKELFSSPKSLFMKLESHFLISCLLLKLKRINLQKFKDENMWKAVFQVEQMWVFSLKLTKKSIMKLLLDSFVLMTTWWFLSLNQKSNIIWYSEWFKNIIRSHLSIH